MSAVVFRIMTNERCILTGKEEAVFVEVFDVICASVIGIQHAIVSRCMVCCLIPALLKCNRKAEEGKKVLTEFYKSNSNPA